METFNFKDDFNDQKKITNHWENASQNNSPENYELKNNQLKILVRAKTKDRVKVRTKRFFTGYGSFIWKVYVPKYKIGDQTSIGAFLYFDDKHEIDFEIGSGTNTIRKELNAKENDLVVYCTSQYFPFSSTPFLIKNESWHYLKIELSKGINGFYRIKWYINDKLLKTLQVDYNVSFQAYCSLENLNFIGDRLPVTNNFVLFDKFIFKK